MLLRPSTLRSAYAFNIRRPCNGCKVLWQISSYPFWWIVQGQQTCVVQEKYRRKKAKKYMLQLTLCQATTRTVCETCFTKSPSKTCYLRIDTLSLMLSLANIGAHAQVHEYQALAAYIAQCRA